MQSLKRNQDIRLLGFLGAVSFCGLGGPQLLYWAVLRFGSRKSKRKRLFYQTNMLPIVTIMTRTIGLLSKRRAHNALASPVSQFRSKAGVELWRHVPSDQSRLVALVLLGSDRFKVPHTHLIMACFSWKLYERAATQIGSYPLKCGGLIDLNMAEFICKISFRRCLTPGYQRWCKARTCIYLQHTTQQQLQDTRWSQAQTVSFLFLFVFLSAEPLC